MKLFSISSAILLSLVSVPSFAQTPSNGLEFSFTVIRHCDSLFNDPSNLNEKTKSPIAVHNSPGEFYTMNFAECFMYHFAYSRGMMVQECINENKYSDATREEKFKHCNDWFDKKYNTYEGY